MMVCVTSRVHVKLCYRIVSYRIVSKIPVHQSPGLREEGHPHPAKYSHNFVLVRAQS